MLRIVTAFTLIFLLVLLPECVFALEIVASKIQIGARVIAFCNIVLFFTSIVSFKQYFWPGSENRVPFHFFNIIFIVLFYAVSLPFLVMNRQYYEVYQNLAPSDILAKFFFTLDVSSFAQWVILASVVLNVLYISKNYGDYFRGGVGVVAIQDDERSNAADDEG
jgi:hypothetical protein